MAQQVGPRVAAAAQVTRVSHGVVMRAGQARLMRRIYLQGVLVDEEVTPCVRHLRRSIQAMEKRRSFRMWQHSPQQHSICGLHLLHITSPSRCIKYEKAGISINHKILPALPGMTSFLLCFGCAASLVQPHLCAWLQSGHFVLLGQISLPSFCQLFICDAAHCHHSGDCLLLHVSTSLSLHQCFLISQPTCKPERVVKLAACPCEKCAWPLM